MAAETCETMPTTLAEMQLRTRNKDRQQRPLNDVCDWIGVQLILNSEGTFERFIFLGTYLIRKCTFVSTDNPSGNIYVVILRGA